MIQKKLAKELSRAALRRLKWRDFAGRTLERGDVVITPTGRKAALLYGNDDFVTLQYLDDDDLVVLKPVFLCKAKEDN